MIVSNVVPRNVKRTTSASAALKQFASDLCTHYYIALRSAQMTTGRYSRGAAIEPTYKTIDAITRRAFRVAAEAAMQVDATPREYVVAQFQCWATYSQYAGKVVIPMPQHMASLGAQARFIQYRLQNRARTDRDVSTAETSLRSHYREERLLKGLVRVLRIPPEDVLAEKPEEFSREFLAHKNVWSLVESIWHERRA